MGKKVAIIGAGTSGLLACKYTLSKGFQPIVFESASTIGGVWTKTIETTRLQTPREAYRFSDFPWPSSVTEDFPNQHQVLDYIKSYAHHFDLLKHLKFNTKVCGIEYEGPSEDEMQAWSLWGGSGEPFSSKGKWKVVITADPEFNNYIFQQEERMVELWYLDMFSKIFVHEGKSKTNAVGMVHKYVRSIFLNHFGAERLKEKLLPQIEEFVNKSLCAWSSKASVEVEHAGSVINFNPT
ncbi:hypothetical protein GBA52_027840 [Prunus armeniaca]|nr:hypothetical protein GBA52_027840 [Prunus armeniaca]